MKQSIIEEYKNKITNQKELNNNMVFNPTDKQKSLGNLLILVEMVLGIQEDNL